MIGKLVQLTDFHAKIELDEQSLQRIRGDFVNACAIQQIDSALPVCDSSIWIQFESPQPELLNKWVRFDYTMRPYSFVSAGVIRGMALVMTDMTEVVADPVQQSISEELDILLASSQA